MSGPSHVWVGRTGAPRLSLLHIRTLYLSRRAVGRATQSLAIHPSCSAALFGTHFRVSDWLLQSI